MKYIIKIKAWVMSAMAQSMAERSRNLEKEGYGWAMSEYAYGDMTLNEIIGAYETARAQGKSNEAYTGVLRAINEIRNTPHEKLTYMQNTGPDSVLGSKVYDSDYDISTTTIGISQ